VVALSDLQHPEAEPDRDEARQHGEPGEDDARAKLVRRLAATQLHAISPCAARAAVRRAQKTRTVRTAQRTPPRAPERATTPPPPTTAPRGPPASQESPCRIFKPEPGPPAPTLDTGFPTQSSSESC